MEGITLWLLKLYIFFVAAVAVDAQSHRFGGNITADQGHLTHPDYPAGYRYNLNLTWYISVTNPLDKIYFHVAEYDIHRTDYLKITDVATGYVLQTVNGQGTNVSVAGSSTTIKVVFKTNSFSNGKGWIAKWTRIPPCGEPSTGSSGVIQSPLYPEPYPNNVDCEWIITAPEGSALSFNVSSFDVERSVECGFDSLQFKAINSTVLSTHCGRDPFMVHIRSNPVKVFFTSDAAFSSSGWQLTWKAVPPVCGGQFNQESGIINSPRLTEDSICIWNITLPLGQQIVLNATAFLVHGNSKCNHGTLMYIDGNTGSVISAHSGSESFAFLAETNVVQVTFNSSGPVEEGAWSLHWEGKGSPELCGMEACGAEFLDQVGGTIQSSSYTSNYTDYVTCTWNITSSPGTSLQLTVTEFDVNCGANSLYEALEVYNLEDGSLLGKHCGSKSFTTETNSNAIQIIFKTDRGRANSGFTLDWLALQGSSDLS